MLALKNEKSCERALSMLPEGIYEEITRLARSRRGGASDVREIRLRVGGVCSVLFGRERVPLIGSVSDEQMRETVDRLTDGALYAHRDSLCEGYVTLDGSVRVGLVGTAKYDSGCVVGISDIHYALFRFPHPDCDFRRELYDVWTSDRRGMLIYSPPGVGKTTALRALAQDISRGDGAMRVAIVDERFEFPEEYYHGCEVDVLRGYKRRAGLEIATRTMSPEVIIMDEIGADDAVGIAECARCGIPLIASVHAGSYEELCMKNTLEPLMRCGAFGVFVGIERVGVKYFLKVNRA